MDSKSRRQRYTRQWKCARRSLAERIVGEQLQCNPITFQHGQDPINIMERNDHDADMQSAFECVENEGSEQNCSPGHEGVEYGVIEGNYSSGQKSGIDALYDHFMAFSVALSLLLSPSLAVVHNKYSTELMTYFVAKTKDLYGEQFMVYNIHSMIHLPAEAIHFGSLDACSAFPFENFLGKLKRLVRSGKQPLVQVAKRLMEISVSPQTQFVVAAKCKLSRPNNGFILGEGKCCEAIEERVESDESGSPVVLCKVFEKCEPLFMDPCDSRMEKKTLAVLEFADDNSIEIVPTTWLEEATEDILAMQRTILAALAPSNMADEDILDGPCQTLEDFAQLDKMLEKGDKRTKMLNYLRSLGGADEGAAVRKMMRKVASTEVLSAYSLKGRKGKLAFQSLRICNIIIKATQKNFKTLKVIDVGDLIGLVKFAPHRNLKWSQNWTSKTTGDVTGPS
ncbi:hypothetical protein E1301_Tti019761 [Triplophysa tibetana]|uniref:DUF4806 domain-containing protein n=1 Tax=Triplophysa tibetana TaxID=1572043 RepID=A0A5A9PJZ9_9TELE|nr:hypothetical protein E1301_Tti019761 [Triplophysa tibetana]